jgi:GDPmannose 4,6-dehydratase
MTSIIFGINGQDGFYLSQLLQNKNHHVIGISKNNNIANITDYHSVSELIKKEQPDFVFHLAANSTTRHEAMFENHATISTGTLNILEAVKNFSPQTKVFISGSGLQFKNENKPIKETDEFEARDAYAVSRIQSVFAARYFRNRFGLKIYAGYFFNHDSPQRTERHVAKKISEAAKRISKGSNEKLEIGDIKTIKEWTFAGDVVEGIYTFINQEKIFEANIGSGIGYSIEDWLHECFGYFHLDWKKYVVLKNDFIAEYKMLVCNPALINSLGWKAKTDFKQLAEMMLNNSLFSEK